ncbi:MAG: hypothetical protein MJ252_07070 [archaeon]|nr:hypothetical protein [archaeon]
MKGKILLILFLFYCLKLSLCLGDLYESEEYKNMQKRLLKTLYGTKNIRTIILLLCSLYICYYLSKIMNRKNNQNRRSKNISLNEYEIFSNKSE